MKKTISKTEFVCCFSDYGRGDNFSVDGRDSLFDYLESLEENTGEEIELDVIAICCDFTEYDSLEDFNEAYNKDFESIDQIEEETTVIRINDKSFIIQNY